MERRPDDLTGLSMDQAREYVAAHIASLKLTEKKLAELDADIAKWRGRADLARGKNALDLAASADAEIVRIEADRARIGAEADELSGQIDSMRRQLGALPSKERSIDPDLLEQELLMMAGKMPGDEAAVNAERQIAAMEKQSRADADLAALKERLSRENGGN